MTSELLVLGGGAAGLLAAQTAAEKGLQVTLLEARERVGKKLLATGNGRCNLSNLHVSLDRYAPAALEGRLLTTEMLLSLFMQLGLETRADGEGRLYPRSNQAASVLDVLRFSLERQVVRCVTEFEAVRTERSGGGFTLHARDGRTESGRALLLACGGRAASRQDGYALARQLGHSVTPLKPALTYLTTEPSLVRGLQGQRTVARVSLLQGGRELAAEEGELLFRDKALSGIAVFDLSRVRARTKGDCELRVDLLPDWDDERTAAELARRRALFSPAGVLLTGLFPRPIAERLLERAGLRVQDMPDDKQLRGLATLLHDWRFPVTGSGGFDQAQLCVGGVPLNELQPGGLRSARCEGLYLAGELLDADGPCGGYNLHLAFSTGYLAACEAAEDLRPRR